MKVLTNTVKDNDGRIDRVTYDCQHTSNEGISYGNSGNRIEGKDNQNIVEKCKDCTACETDILETEPDIQKHEDCCHYNGNNCISSHLAADCGRNTFCLDQGFIYIKLVNKCFIQCLTFIKVQRTCLNDNLIGSYNLSRLYVLISCYLLYKRCYLRVNGLNVHVLVEGYICGGTT